MWGGRFAEGPSAIMREINASIPFDKALWRQDIAASKAHVAMLAQQGIVSAEDAAAITGGLDTVAAEYEASGVPEDWDLEDIHMTTESRLATLIGAPAGRLHTARSRNDQVATDLRLWVRDVRIQTVRAMRELMLSLVTLAERNADVVIPGYTHLQRAQPVLLAHHLLAYVEMLNRDCQRTIINTNLESPLGSGAMAGSTLKLDREFVARELVLADVSKNSMDAVSSRDFVLMYLFCAAMAGMHLSRLAEDLILWSTAEFGFITIGDAYTTGSSLMPQKKNPDICELVRGKTGRLYGNLVAVLTMMKGLPLTYNRDMQEDKEPLFDSADTLLASLRVMADMLRHTKVNRPRCEAAASDPMLLATDLVDFLVKKGVPFREAHHKVGTLVAESEKTGTPLPKLAGKKYGPAAARVFDVRRALAARTATGAPSPKNVRVQIARWKKLLK